MAASISPCMKVECFLQRLVLTQPLCYVFYDNKNNVMVISCDLPWSQVFKTLLRLCNLTRAYFFFVKAKIKRNKNISHGALRSPQEIIIHFTAEMMNELSISRKLVKLMICNLIKSISTMLEFLLLKSEDILVFSMIHAQNATRDYSTSLFLRALNLT